MVPLTDIQLNGGARRLTSGQRPNLPTQHGLLTAIPDPRTVAAAHAHLQTDPSEARRDMEAACLSAQSALAGSAVGGLASGLASWMSQRAQAKAGRLAHEMSRRQELYQDFIIAASKAYGEALMSNELQVRDVIALYATVSRVRVVSVAARH